MAQYFWFLGKVYPPAVYTAGLHCRPTEPVGYSGYSYGEYAALLKVKSTYGASTCLHRCLHHCTIVPIPCLCLSPCRPTLSGKSAVRELLDLWPFRLERNCLVLLGVAWQRLAALEL